MPKLDKTLARLIPPGPLRDMLRSAYYLFYYNMKHAGQNGFRMYYKRGYYEFLFPTYVMFKCYENIADELQRSMSGYLAKYDLKTGDVVIDCGAYIGEFTLYAAKAVGETGRVIAFEPDPDSCKKLARNISLNNLHNVIVIEKGVWSKKDRLRFSDVAQGANLFAGREAGDTASRDVFVADIDSELEAHGIKRVDFVKMDIEGAEIEAIKGARNILIKNNVCLAVASYHDVGGRKSYIELEKILQSLGYETETAHPAHLTTYGCKPKA